MLKHEAGSKIGTGPRQLSLQTGARKQSCRSRVGGMKNTGRDPLTHERAGERGSSPGPPVCSEEPVHSFRLLA